MIKRFFLYACIVVSAVAFVGYFFLFPDILSYVGQFYAQKIAKQLHLEYKTLQVNDHCYEYLEGGKGQEVIVMIHGFQADKLSFSPFLQSLKEHYRVIAVDLPGHGGSLMYDDHSLSIYAFADDVIEFCKAKNLEEVHLFGQSMGGGIATVVALKEPHLLKSLILLNPMGVTLKEKSDLLQKAEEGKNMFFPASLEELDELGCYLIGKPFSWKTMQKWMILQKMKIRQNFYEDVFVSLIKTKPLDDKLGFVKTPVLLLASGKDRVLPPSSFTMFHEKLPNVKTIYFQKGHHILLGECFQEAIEEIKIFTGEMFLQKQLLLSEADHG